MRISNIRDLEVCPRRYSFPFIIIHLCSSAIGRSILSRNHSPSGKLTRRDSVKLLSVDKPASYELV